MEKKDFFFEFNKVYGEMFWVFFYRYMIVIFFFQIGELGFLFMIYQYLYVLNVLEFNKKELVFFKGKRNIILGENVYRDIDIMFMFVKQVQEKD